MSCTYVTITESILLKAVSIYSEDRLYQCFITSEFRSQRLQVLVKGLMDLSGVKWGSPSPFE